MEHQLTQNFNLSKNALSIYRSVKRRLNFLDSDLFFVDFIKRRPYNAVCS